MNQDLRPSQVKSVCSRTIFRLSLLALTLFLTMQSANAQSTGGRVRGTVTDASGSAVVGATVSLINAATNIYAGRGRRMPRGNTSFLEVPVGSYEVDVIQPGFKKFVRKGHRAGPE